MRSASERRAAELEARLAALEAEVRAVQEASPAINAGTLRCRAGDQRACQQVEPCYGDFRSDEADDCLAPAEERAWSSPIFIDHG